MEFELLKLLQQFDNLKEKTKLNDIKTSYSNLETLYNGKNKFEGIPDNIYNNCGTTKKATLELNEKYIQKNISVIINESYKSFQKLQDEDDSEEILRNLVLDIQKSSFYEEYKDNFKIKSMEIDIIMIEAEEDEDFINAKEKLLEFDKKVYDLELKEKIEFFVDQCENNIIDKEIREINKLTFSEDFEKVFEKYDQLFINYPNKLGDIYKDYLSLLENLIKKKIKRNEQNIIEIEKYKIFINKYKDKIDNYNKEIQKVIKFEKEKFWKLEQQKVGKMEKEKEKKINEIFNKINRSKEQIDYYLEEIKKYIPDKDISEFEKTKLYIYEQISNYEEEERNCFSKSEIWVSDKEKYKYEISNIKNIGRIYAYFNHINKKKTLFDIHTIQLISLLLLSNELPNGVKGIYCKINTGEGKSTIIQFFAAYKVLLGNKVDIITSSLVLADRDANDEDKLPFFQKLKISVGCLKENEDTKYDLDILYGDSTNFSADILRQDYDFIQTRKDRGYDVVIIDEVDNMCIDNLLTKTQLTKTFPGYQSLYTFYYTIILSFCFVADEMKLTNDKYEINKKRETIKNLILKKIKDNPTGLKNNLSNEIEVKDAVRDYLVGADQNKIKSEDKKIQKLLNQDGTLFEIDGKNIAGILYPNYLKEEIEENIQFWIDSVITSVTMAENIDFRIIQENGFKKIIPIDYSNTGSSQTNMVWNEGLHQILQIYNDVEVFPENTNTNYLYMITFFKKYKELYGLTGTIGSKVNQEALQTLYRVKLYFIPPNLKPQLTKRSELVFTQKIEWENQIISEIKQVLSENRSVLLICISIKEGEKFAQLIKNNNIKNIKKYFTEDHKSVVKENLYPNYVIIATNLAGRGTDIKISKDLESAGGLHVIVSFLPLNQRVEDQNYGRAGRKGQKGSYSLIFYYYDEMNDPLLTVESIKNKREFDERKRFEDFVKYDEKNMIEEEKLFDDYCQFRNQVLKICDNQFVKKDNEYHWGKIINSKESFENKKALLEKLKNNNKEILNPLIKIQYYIENIGALEDKIEIFEKEKFYSWPLKMEYATHLAEIKEFEKAIDYYEEAKQNLLDFQIDIKNQTILQLLIFKSLKKNENINLDENQTQIGQQNTRKKQFLQVIIDIIDANIAKIREYEQKKEEDKKISRIIKGESKDVFTICEEKLNLKDKNSEEVKDLLKFSREFGIENFSFIIITSEPHFWKNYIVFITGVVEITVGVILSVKGIMTGKLKMVQFGIFLIRQGFNDIVAAFEHALKGEEFNLQHWLEKKAIEYGKCILKMIMGPSTLTPTAELVSMFSKEIVKTVSHYAIRKTAEYGYKKILSIGVSKFQQYAGKVIGGAIIKKITKKSNEEKKLIVMDLVNNDKLFKNYILAQTHEICIFIRYSLEIFKELIHRFKEITEMTFDFYSIRKEIRKTYPLIQKITKAVIQFCDKIKINEKDFTTTKNEIEKKYGRFDGTLKGLIELFFNTYNDDTERKIKPICEELIKYNVIKENGEFDIVQINNKELIQDCKIEINEELKTVKTIENVTLLESRKKILGLEFKEIQEVINFIHIKSFEFNKKQINMYKDKLNEEISKTVFEDMQYLIDMLCGFLVKKVKVAMNNFCENYEKKKNKQKPRKNNLTKPRTDNGGKNEGDKERNKKSPTKKPKKPPTKKPPKSPTKTPPKHPPPKPPKPPSPKPPNPSFPHGPSGPSNNPISSNSINQPNKKPIIAQRDIRRKHNGIRDNNHTIKREKKYSINNYGGGYEYSGFIGGGGSYYNSYSGYSGINSWSYIPTNYNLNNNENKNVIKTNELPKVKEERPSRFNPDYPYNPYSSNNQNEPVKTNGGPNRDNSKYDGGKKNNHPNKKFITGNGGGNSGFGGKTDEEKEPEKKNISTRIREGAQEVGGAVVGLYDYLKNDKELHETMGKVAYNAVDCVKDVNLDGILNAKKVITLYKGDIVMNRKMIKILDHKNRIILQGKKLEELEEKRKKKSEENDRKKKLIEEGNKKWKIYKDKFRLKKLKEINYMDLVEETVLNNYSIFKENILKEIGKVYSQQFEQLGSKLIQEKHNSIFQRIKNDIKQIKSLNFMIAGFTGVGKSTLTNALLKFNEAEESDGIDPKTKEMKSYSNPNGFPGLTIIDTIGVEPDNVQRNISEIKKMIKEKFDENLNDPEKALHGILYCIKNSPGDKRITKEEINYIKELNKLYGDGDIVIIVFTRTINNKTEERKKLLKEKLNNDNIKIVEILAKDEMIYGYNIKAFGIEKLIEVMKKQCKESLIKCNIKITVKKKIKDKYLEDINKIYKNIKQRLRKRSIESSFLYRLTFILENLLGNINLDFRNIEKIITDTIENLFKKIMKILKMENDEKIRKKIKNEFIIFNSKYDNLLQINIEEYENYIFNLKFKEYFEPKIKKELENILFEKVAILFMEKSIEIISQKVSEEVKDAEIEYIVNLNIDKLFPKEGE